MAIKFQKLQADYQHLLSEFNTLKCKLECKTDSLLILSQEQAQCRSERDQYKLMATQLRERYSALKKRVEGWGPSLLGVYDLHEWKGDREQSLIQLLCDSKEQNKALKHDVEEYKQKYIDAQGDVRMLREEITRSRRGSTCEDIMSKHHPNCDRENLIGCIEKYKYKCQQHVKDVEALLDEKEELILSRDAFRLKYERLNQQMNCLLRGDQHSYVDIDGVIMENRYLQERIKQIMEEKNMATTALTRCKSLLDKKRQSSNLRLSSIAAGLAISAKQVEQMLQNHNILEKSKDSHSANDVRNLVLTLLEALSDSSLALLHQKKTNKILGTRVAELEQKVKSIEASSLCQFRDSGHLAYLSKMIVHSEDSVVCEKLLASSVLNSSTPSLSENVYDDQVSVHKDESFSPDVDYIKEKKISSFSDLDLLPTKDDCLSEYKMCRSSKCTHDDSSSSVQSTSSQHRTVDIHSDSEISPKKKKKHSQFNSTSLQNSPIYTQREHCSADLEMDDLPPKLQELIAAALLDIEKGSNEQQNEDNLQQSVIEDPSC